MKGVNAGLKEFKDGADKCDKDHYGVSWLVYVYGCPKIVYCTKRGIITEKGCF